MRSETNFPGDARRETPPNLQFRAPVCMEPLSIAGASPLTTTSSVCVSASCKPMQPDSWGFCPRSMITRYASVPLLTKRSQAVYLSAAEYTCSLRPPLDTCHWILTSNPLRAISDRYPATCWLRVPTYPSHAVYGAAMDYWDGTHLTSAATAHPCPLRRFFLGATPVASPTSISSRTRARIRLVFRRCFVVMSRRGQLRIPSVCGLRSADINAYSILRYLPLLDPHT
ncbi:hypothetical protein B0H10DRAFT_1298112 [Mycena sp. CBHHK59/15]|nr:hypothetical protein B0H10DRAFT_1298112 [Mycena sp. CBHHK59/15]